MRKIRYGLIVLAMLLCSATSVAAEVSIGIWTPHVSIGINVPLYPQLVPVPGYPVYYAPRLHANYFFYDGMYWVYEDDNWYASSWYNGPWWFVEPYDVPLFILRIPVRYYMLPPVYFRGWHMNAPPRWGHHWGPEWEDYHRGWDRWQRSSAPKRAPLPLYQRQYSGERYPRVEEQPTIRDQHYRYQPREKAAREHFQQQLEQRGPSPAQRERGEEPHRTRPRQQETQRPTMPGQDGPDDRRWQPQPRGGNEDFQRSAPEQSYPQRRGPVIREQRQQPDAVPREQNAPRSRDQDREDEQGVDRGRGQGGSRDEDRGRGRNY